MENKKKVPNQLHRELMSVCGLNPWDGADSSGRKQMFSSHIGQALVISGSTERRCQTGMEREFGKFTFNIKMPYDGKIIRVIDRYRPGYGPDSIAMNPQTVAIYERNDTKEVGIINIPTFCSPHQYFGFEYKHRPAMSQLRPNNEIAQGTIFCDSPSVTDNGGYKYGRECNMAFMSHPAVSEDGVMISRDVLKEFSFKTYEHRTIEWGKRRFPLNLYGNEKNYKPFPDIGEYLRPDGMLMALRDYDTDLAVVEQNIYSLMEPEFVFDKTTYAAGEGGRVVDIKIYHDGDVNYLSGQNEGMDAQPLKYERARREFYQTVMDEYKRLRRDSGQSLRISREFHRLVIEAMSVVGTGVPGDNEVISKIHRQAPLDDWRVEFVIEYEITPTIGFKLTGTHGKLHCRFYQK